MRIDWVCDKVSAALLSSTVDRQMREHKRKRRRKAAYKRPPLSIPQILAWADEWFLRCGRWPKHESGAIPGSLGENWGIVEGALSKGYRGLPGGSSLAQLLAAQRGVRNPQNLPALSEEQILAWADEWFARTGRWPKKNSAGIPGYPGETWKKVNEALYRGLRGLPGGSSLARLLTAQRGVRNEMDLPAFTEEQILAWADEWFQRTGRWPNSEAGDIPGSQGENWSMVQNALYHGVRGLSGGSSLPQLLAQKRGVRNGADLPALSEEQILAWADTHFQRTGRWPKPKSGPIAEAPGETWTAVAVALAHGTRGLPGGHSLARLLHENRGVRNMADLPPFTVEQILAWADEWFQRTVAWPKYDSGEIPGSQGENWSMVQNALFHGIRGLPGGSSLARLLAQNRGVRNEAFLRP
jgi:hypothetical protein